MSLLRYCHLWTHPRRQGALQGESASSHVPHKSESRPSLGSVQSQHETFAGKLSSVRALPQHKKTSSGVQNFAVSEGYRNPVIKANEWGADRALFFAIPDMVCRQKRYTEAYRGGHENGESDRSTSRSRRQGGPDDFGSEGEPREERRRTPRPAPPAPLLPWRAAALRTQCVRTGRRRRAPAAQGLLRWRWRPGALGRLAHPG